MYNLDGNLFETIEEASRTSGIARSTLEAHVNTTWKSRKGIEHTMTEVEDLVQDSVEVSESDVNSIVVISPKGFYTLYSDISDIVNILDINPVIVKQCCECTHGYHTPLVSNMHIRKYQFYYSREFFKKHLDNRYKPSKAQS